MFNNQKAVSREFAKSIGKKYEELNLIVAHLGGGFSFGAHKKGKTINVSNALAGEGPMSPERSGQIPAQGLINLCFSDTTIFEGEISPFQTYWAIYFPSLSTTTTRLLSGSDM